MATKSRWWVVTGVYAGLIAVVSVIPIPPTAPKGLLSLDKAMHLCEYGLLAWLLMIAMRCSAWAFGISVSAAFLSAAAYGAWWEAVQGWLPYRSAELADFITNTLGAGLGVGIAALASRPRGIRE